MIIFVAKVSAWKMSCPLFFFLLRHGFDLIVKNTFYTVPIEEEEDGRVTSLGTFLVGRIRLDETSGGVNSSVPTWRMGSQDGGKWLGSPLFISHLKKPFGRGITPFR